VSDTPAPSFVEDLVTQLADAAGAHRCSVMRRLLGLPVKGRAGARVDAAIRSRGRASFTFVSDYAATPPAGAP
jgi:hypothetical protein